MRKYKDKKWLFQKYKIEKLSLVKTAKLCGVANRTIWRWLKKFNIETRTLSEAGKGQTSWNKGKHFSKATKKKMSIARKGKKLSKITKKRMSISRKGEKNGRWKGGRKKRELGYIEIYQPNHLFVNKRGYVLEHRFIAEKALGRYLKPSEVVHHINKIRDDNRNCNLLICTQSYHIWLHNKMKYNAIYRDGFKTGFNKALGKTIILEG